MHYTLWAVDSGKVQAAWSMPQFGGYVAALSPDGKSAVTGDWTVRCVFSMPPRAGKRSAWKHTRPGRWLRIFTRRQAPGIGEQLWRCATVGCESAGTRRRSGQSVGLRSRIGLLSDGRRLAVGGSRLQAVKLWDLAPTGSVYSRRARKIPWSSVLS